MDKSLEQLIRECKSDISSLEQIYIMLKPEVFAFGLSALRNRSLAEDCVQETFLRLHKCAKKFNGDTGGREFILKIASNIIKELYRKQRRELLQSSDTPPLEPSEEPDFSESPTVQKALSLLDDNQRMVFTLKVFSDLTFEQISKVLHIPTSSVKYTYYRSVEILNSKKEAYI